MVIGISTLFPRLVRLSILMLAIQMVTTMMRLVLLPAIAWTKPLILTLEGQYITKRTWSSYPLRAPIEPAIVVAITEV